MDADGRDILLLFLFRRNRLSIYIRDSKAAVSLGFIFQLHDAPDTAAKQSVIFFRIIICNRHIGEAKVRDCLLYTSTETFDGNEAAIKEAATVLESQGAKYRNLSIDSASDAGKYASDIMAFPTTILVDRNGNIVGDPMLGGIDNQENYDALMKQIQSVIDADNANK